MSFYRTQLEEFLKTVDVDAESVLDIGGSDKPVNGRTRSWNVKHSYIADIENNADIFLDMNLPLPKSQLLQRKYDVIFCLEVFEYLIDPMCAIRNIAALLTDGGRAYISFCFLYPHHNPLQYDSLRYTEFGVRRLAEAAGLKIAEITRRRMVSNSALTYYSEDGMRAARGYDHDVTGFIVELTK